MELIVNNEITGIVGNENIKELLDNNGLIIGQIGERDFFTKTVSDEFFLVKKDVKDKKNYIEKVLSSIKMVGLNDDYLEKEIDTLSKTEKLLIEIALSLVINPDIIVFNNIFNNFDRRSKLNIKKIILELKRNYNKTIVIIDNINVLYEICNNILIFKDKNLLLSGNKKDVFDDIELLIENNIELPFFIEFSYISKNYNKNINYYQEVNDLLKGVYKNAR